MTFCMDDLAPFLRYIHYIELIPAFTTHQQIGYDHRLFFCVSGDYAISAGGQTYEMKENSLLFVPSGVSYHLHRPESSVLLVGVNFDFTRAHEKQTAPIAPAFREENFVRSALLESCVFDDVPAFNRPFLLTEQHALWDVIRQMLEEYTTKRLYYHQKNDALLKDLLVTLARTLISGHSEPQSTADVVIAYIRAHYMERCTNTDIGRDLNFHPNYLNRVMLTHTGKSLHQYLLSYRLTKALDLLQNTALTVTQIAEETGFGDVQSFSKFFQARTGTTPGSFR